MRIPRWFAGRTTSPTAPPNDVVAASSPADASTGVVDSRPVWLLDVDGVINASGAGWPGVRRTGRASAGGVSFPMTWSDALLDRIRTIDASGAVEIRWATTWVEWIEEIETLLEVPRWPVAFPARSGGSWSPGMPTPRRKLSAALGVLETERRPLIWTDDDAIPTRGHLRERIERAPAPALLIAPDWRSGLQPGHVAAIERFLADLAGPR